MTSSTATSLPPHDKAAEVSVLGTILRHCEALDDLDFLRPEDFGVYAHVKIFEGMLELHAAGKPVDAVTVADWINDKQLTADIGGDSYFVDLVNGASSGFNCVHHARIVKGKSLLRQMIHAGSEIARDALDSVDSPEALLDAAEAKILGIAEGTAPEPVMVVEPYKQALDQLNERTSASYRDGAVLTGLHGFDESTGGFQPGELVVVAARTSIGKTTFALNVAWNAAFEAEVPVLFFSLEQSAVEIAYRLGARHTGIDSRKFRRPSTLNETDVSALVDAVQIFDGKPLYIDDTRGQSVLRIAAVTRRMKRKKGIRLVAIDYLQFVTAEDARAPRHEQVAVITRRLKELARELNLPVMVLAQLNRDADKDEVPRLSHLRESGSIEQDADTVILLYQPQSTAAPRNCLSAIVAKQRNGAVGQVDFYYDKPTGKISDLTLL